MRYLIAAVAVLILASCSNKSQKELESLYRESIRLEKVIVQERTAGHKNELAKAITAYQQVYVGLKKYHESEIYEVMKREESERKK